LRNSSAVGNSVNLIEALGGGWDVVGAGLKEVASHPAKSPSWQSRRNAIRCVIALL
jgi:hypothetical protein